MLESQRNLYESNLFRLATIQVPETFDSIKTVNVGLREARLHEMRAQRRIQHGGLRPDRRPLHALQPARRRTAAGRDGGGRQPVREPAQRLVHLPASRRWIRCSTGNPDEFLQPTWQTNIQFTQPAFLRRPRNSLSFGAFAQRRAVPAVAIDRGYGGNITYTRSLGLRAPASLGYVFAVTNVLARRRVLLRQLRRVRLG